jgi:hypothetical protein
LQLRNNLDSSDLTVVPAVRTANGVETALPSVTIKAGDVVSVDLSDALMKSAPSLAGAWGSLVLRYNSLAHRALYCAVMVRGDGRPIAFHLDGNERGSRYEVGSREGIWWLPWTSVTDYLILTNTGDQVLQPNLVIFDSTGNPWQQKLSLGAFQTQRLSIRSLLQQAGLNGSYGGFRIDLAAGARYLDSTHLLFDESGGFSAIMKMFKHDPATALSSRAFGGVTEWTTRAPMLALSNPDPALGFPAGTTLQPKVFIRNASGKAVTAHLRFNWRSATTSGKSAPIDLAFKANETQVVDVAALQAQKLLPADANWASVILSASVLPDELLAVAASYDQTGHLGAQTPFSDQLATHWEAGKWEVDGLHNSLVTIANGGNTLARAQLTILYNQGAGQYQVEQTLAPDEQIVLDFGKLIRNQVPDKNGHTLPTGLTGGTYRLLDLNDNPLGSLYEGKVIVDKTNGHASYGCMICCGPNNPYMLYDPLAVAAGGSQGQTVKAVNSCNGQLVTVTGDFPTWWTDNTSIATATSSSHQINGVAVGKTNHYAQSINMYWGLKEDAPECDLSQEEPSAPTNVPPTITNISPPQGPIGTTVSVTITGSGFGSNPTVNTVQGITATVQNSSDTSITANFAISTNPPTTGNSNVTVTNVATSLNSNGVNFYIQVPTSLSIVPGSSSTTPEASCTFTSGGTQYTGCGVTRSFIYQVNDQETPSQPIQAAGLQVWDAINTTTPNYLNISGYTTTCTGTPAGTNSGPCNVTTNSSGQFGENSPGLSVCSTVCRVNNACTTGGPTNANQTVHVGTSVIVQSISYYCDHITVNGQ